ncbi:MAG: hypothetical protein JO007_18145 [Alphaproteobacteria bacterium]|nr:hypothetical protein [Alphaproteobacteria bacterium]
MAEQEIVPYSLSEHPDPHRHAVSNTALLACLFVPPVMWAGNLIIDYALVGHSCYPGEVPLTRPTAGFVWPLIFAFHLLALLVIAASFLLALRNWRVTGPPMGHAHQLMHRGEGRSRYFGIVAMGWAAVLFVVVATQTVAFYWVPLCER